MQQRERLRGVAVVVRRLGGNREVQDAAALGRLRRCGRQRRRREKNRDRWLSSQVSLQPPLCLPGCLLHPRRPARLGLHGMCSLPVLRTAEPPRRLPAEAQSSRKTFRQRRNAASSARGDAMRNGLAPSAGDALVDRCGDDAGGWAKSAPNTLRHSRPADKLSHPRCTRSPGSASGPPACSGRSPCGRCGRCRTRGSRGRGRCGRSCRCGRSGNRGPGRCPRPAAPKHPRGSGIASRPRQSAQASAKHARFVMAAILTLEASTRCLSSAEFPVLQPGDGGLLKRQRSPVPVRPRPTAAHGTSPS